MNYLSYLKIKYFKGIEELELNDLSNINIIIGENNCGKTSILEAISFLEYQNSIKAMLDTDMIKNENYRSKLELFLDIFPKEQDIEKIIQINSTINGLTRELKIGGILTDLLNNKENELESKAFEGTISIKSQDKYLMKKKIVLKENKIIKDSNSTNITNIIHITSYNNFNYGFRNSSIEKLNEIDKNKILQLLKMFDSNILDFKIISNKNNKYMIYINHQKYGLMNLFSFGDGIKKVFSLASALASAKNGILLIDEIETAIHKNLINEVVKWIIDTCKEYEVQLICTTHSLEAIDGIIMGVGNETDLLSCFRMETYEDKIYSTKFSGDKLKDIRTLLGQDVR